MNNKPLQITGKTAFEQLQEEKLLPLPSKVILDRYRYEARSVSKDGFISYDGVRYGVPWEYSGRQVTVRAIKNKIEILFDLFVSIGRGREGRKNGPVAGKSSPGASYDRSGWYL